MSDYVLAVCLVTYNHEEYIAKCIESVLDQQTSFKYIIVIGEDCSDDNTYSICLKYALEYPEKIKLIQNKTNLGLVENTFNVLENIINADVEYISMMDGDDYWIDNNKLQNDVDCLINNKEYGLVHSSIKVLIDDKPVKYKRVSLTEDEINSFMHLPLGAGTVVFCSDLLKKIHFQNILTQKFTSIDYLIYFIFSQNTKFKFRNKFTTVWRRGHASVSNPDTFNKQLSYIENNAKTWKYLNSLFPNELPLEEEWENANSNNAKLKAAFKYKNYKYANNIIKTQDFTHAKKISKISLLVSISKNKYLFFSYYFIERFANVFIGFLRPLSKV